MTPAAIPWKLIGYALASLALFFGGFFLGRSRGQEPAALIVRNGEKPEINLSPKGSEQKTILAPAIHPGKPEKPPISDQANQVEGEHLSTTTTTTQDAAPAGSRFQLAIYGKSEAGTLALRPVVWLESPQGQRMPIEATTTEQTVKLAIQTQPRPTWAASLLVDLEKGQRPRTMVMVQHDREPWRFSLGAAKHRAILGIGVCW